MIREKDKVRFKSSKQLKRFIDEGKCFGIGAKFVTVMADKKFTVESVDHADDSEESFTIVHLKEDETKFHWPCYMFVGINAKGERIKKSTRKK
jgi:hypothetical protein